MKEIAEQLIFNLNRQGKVGLENFYISKSNQVAVKTIKRWEDWPAKKLLLMGPSGSGKSHLADFWTRTTKARTLEINEISDFNLEELNNNSGFVIDDVDQIRMFNKNDKDRIEEKLFHLLNFSAQASCFLMMTSSAPITSWGLKLSDLISRLATIAVVELFPPDDDLLIAVLLKQFDDKQIKVSPEVVLFVSKRINRTFESIREFVNLADHLTLKNKRDVTIPFVSEILHKLGQGNTEGLSVSTFDPA